VQAEVGEGSAGYVEAAAAVEEVVHQDGGQVGPWGALDELAAAIGFALAADDEAGRFDAASLRFEKYGSNDGNGGHFETADLTGGEMREAIPEGGRNITQEDRLKQQGPEIDEPIEFAPVPAKQTLLRGAQNAAADNGVAQPRGDGVR
jgi:hypothetical protein